MMYFIIDGYNLIGRQKGLRGDIRIKTGETYKRSLTLSAGHSHLVTVVFDGWRTAGSLNTKRMWEMYP